MIYGVFDYVILLSVITVFYNVNPTWNNYYYFFILEPFLFFLKMSFVMLSGMVRKDHHSLTSQWKAYQSA